MIVKSKQPRKWTAEEDAILLKYKTLFAPDIAELLPGRTINSINQRRINLGISLGKPKRTPKKTQDELLVRPITDETAYHVRKDYAAKRKIGYTHEKAIQWLAEANIRKVDVIIDLLENPIHDAQVAVCELKSKYML